MGTHRHHRSPSREESHQAKFLNKGKVQGAPNREDHRNRVRAPLDRGQNQDKAPVGRDLGKDKGRQVRVPNQHRDLLGMDQSKARVRLGKDPPGREPGKAQDPMVKETYHYRDHLGRDPGKKDLLNKDLGSLHQNSRAHQAQGLILGSHLGAEVLLRGR